MNGKEKLSTLLDYYSTRDEAMRFINALKRSNPLYRFIVKRDSEGDYRIYTSSKSSKGIIDKYGI